MENPEPIQTLPSQPGAGAEFHAGDRVGPFRLLEPLGRGGMGEVWRAERDDGQLKRQVALKLPVLAARRSVLAQRFARERDILGALAHPHIARLYDAGITDDNQPYLALELVDGQPITDHCQQQALPVRERVQLMLQVMQAVQHAHANLVIHRDLKPGNVLVTPQGQAMLLDFGIAKLLLGESMVAPETELTMVGGRAMTLEYAAPEQIEGAPISIATDIWALGVLLYELVAGRRPFTGEHRHALEQAVLRSEPSRPCPSTLPRAAAADLDTIVLKALKKRPFERYATVEAFADDLRRWLNGEAVMAQPDSRGYRLRRFVARHRAAVATASALAAFVMLAGGFSLHQARIAEEQSRVARVEAETAKAVQEFLEGIFKANSGDQADPIRARQRTAKELLDEGAARIDQDLADVPAAKLRVLDVLAQMYAHMKDSVRQVALRRTAVALAEKAFPGPTGQRVVALADLASALAIHGEVEQAGRVLQEAQSLLDANRAIGDDARTRFEMTHVLHYVRRDDANGVDVARRLAQRLGRGAPSSDAVGSLLMLGRLERVAGNPAASVQRLQEAIALEARVPGGVAGGLTVLHQELASSLAVVGRLADAEAAQRQSLKFAEANGGATDYSTLNARMNLASLLADIGRADEAAAELDAVRAVVTGRPASVERTQLLLRGAGSAMHAQRLLGRPAAAWALQGPWNVQGPVPIDDPVDSCHLLVSRVETLIDLGRPAEAAATLQEVDALVARHRITGTARRGAALARLRLALLQGRPEVAQQAWDSLRVAGDAARPLALAAEAELEEALRGSSAALAVAQRHVQTLEARPVREGFEALARLRAVMARARRPDSR